MRHVKKCAASVSAKIKMLLINFYQVLNCIKAYLHKVESFSTIACSEAGSFCLLMGCIAGKWALH